jgi:hypothetical protein
MRSHLNAKKHLTRMRALDGPGSGVHAWVTKYAHTIIAEDVLIWRSRWLWASKVPVD